MSEFLEYMQPAAIGGSLLLGLLIGAFYGFNLSSEKPPVYPYMLWVVGLAFVVVLGVNNHLTGLSTTWGFAAARAALWTITCTGIPLGRYLRLRWEHVRLGRRLARVRKRTPNGNGNGH